MKIKESIDNILKIPISIKVSFLIIFSLILFFTQNFILELALFLVALVFMLKIGSAVMPDLDPVPFFTLLLLYLYDPMSAFYFMLLAIPLIDIISGRLNQYSIVNFMSLLATLVFFAFIFPQSLALIYGILIFNTIRVIIYTIAGFGPQSILFSIMHGFLYFILGSIISFLF